MKRKDDDDVRFGDFCSLDLQREIVREAGELAAQLRKIRKGKSGPAKTEELRLVGVTAGTTGGGGFTE